MPSVTRISILEGAADIACVSNSLSNEILGVFLTDPSICARQNFHDFNFSKLKIHDKDETSQYNPTSTVLSTRICLSKYLLKTADINLELH